MPRKPTHPRFTVERLECRTTPAVVSWDGGGGDFNWGTAANWSGDALPGATDDVVIDSGANDFTVVYSGGTTSVASLTCRSDLFVYVGTLLVDGASQVDGDFLLLDTFGGTGDTTVGGAFNCNGGVLSGAGGSLTAAGGTPLLRGVIGGGFRYVNPAGMTATLGSLYLVDDSAIENHGTLALQGFVESSGSATTAFVNTGAVVKPGAISSRINAGTIQNSGTIDIQLGELQVFGTAMSDGAIHGAAGTSLIVWGNLDSPGAMDLGRLTVAYGNTVRVGGAFRADGVEVGNAALILTGAVADLGEVWAGGTLDLTAAALAPAAADFDTLNLNGGILLADEPLTVSGLFTLYQGGLTGAGGSLTANGGTAYLSGGMGGGFRYVNPAGQSAVLGHLYMDDDSVFENHGTLSLEGTLDMAGNGPTAFVNTGAVVKPGASYSSIIAGTIQNSGTIDILAGDLRVESRRAGSVSSGAIRGAAGTSLSVWGDLDSPGSMDLGRLEVYYQNTVTVGGAFRAVRVDVGHALLMLTGTVSDLDAATVFRGRFDLTGATLDSPARALETLGLYDGGELVTGDDLTVADELLWNGWLVGVAGEGSLTVLSDTTLDGHYYLSEFKLINAADLIWAGGSVNFYGPSSRFTNLAGATFEDRAGGHFGSADSNCPVFDNQGLFLKTGAGVTDLHMQLLNSGTVQITQGVLNVDCGIVQVTTTTSGGSSSGTISGSYNGDVTTAVVNSGQVTSDPTPTPPPPVTSYTQTATGSLTVRIGGLTPGTGYGQIVVTGNVNLAGTLGVALINGFTPQVGDTFRIIDNRGANAVTGAFATLPDGETLRVGSVVFQISYLGGTGNDVVLSVLSVNSPPTADAGGPYTVAEGGSVTLAGSGSDPDQAANTLTYEWDLDNDGQFDDATGTSPTFSAVGLDGYAGSTRTVRLRVTDAAGVSDTSTATVSITNASPVPSIDSIGEVRVEGTAISVGGSASDPAGVLDTLTFAWAVYKNGSATPFATGGNTAAFSFTPDDNGSYRIVLTVSDEDGGSATTEQTVSVSNVDPTATLTAPTTGAQGTSLAFGSSVSDPGVADTAAGFAYSWQVSRAGTAIDLTGVPTTGSAFAFVPIEAGTYTVSLTVTDKDGGSVTVTRSVVVSATPGVTLVDGVLTIVGTGCDDEIKVTPGGGAPEIKVNFNGCQTTWNGVTRIVVYANAGDDRVQIAGGVTVPVVAFGGTGDDRLKAGGGSSILVGGDGDDTLLGGSGRDVLIGGRGADRIGGNGADDVLVAGFTSFDANLTALDLIQTEWTSSRGFADRVANLSGSGMTGVNGVAVLRASGAGQTVFDDEAADRLSGDAGNDWFIFNSVGGVYVDQVTDMTAFEGLFDSDL